MERLGVHPDHGSAWKMFCRSGVPAEQEEKRMFFWKCGYRKKRPPEMAASAFKMAGDR
ncbi:MAG: hypothetical protein IJV18_11210 [Acidaminococcaceae bacterium]|nr:hypothetical protein [Acidaminococcaceae bacterium]